MNTRTYQFSLRPLLVGVLLGLPLTASASFGEAFNKVFGKPEPTTTVVLIDRSASIAPEDRALYLASVDVLASSINPGDRVVVATIGDRSRSHFRAELDGTSEITGVRLKDQRNVEALSKALKATALKALDPKVGATAQKTMVVETVASAAQAFGATQARNGRLVLMTDGVQESPLADFSRTLPDAKATEALLKRAQRNALVPDLQGVSVHMVGAGGRDYAGTERFWRSYFAKAGATLASYGRYALRLEQD